MTGSGPFGAKPAGRFNFDPPSPGQALYIEPSHKRVRVIVDEAIVADSRAAKLVHESGHQPIYYFPPEDVDAELLEPGDRQTRCPKKGEASYYSIRVGDRLIGNGAWYYAEPLAGAAPIKGMIAFYFNRMDHWMEENEEIVGHPRDPYHRLDVLQCDRSVRISVQGELLAETRRAVALFETGLPPRWYLPREDVTAELQPSQSTSICPYKGQASYHSVVVRGGEVLDDLVWCYSRPRPEALAIKGLLAFYNERVDVDLDGELQQRPESPWSHAGSRRANLAPAQTRG